MTTHVYLDVDGVINACSHKVPKTMWGWGPGHKVEKINGFWIMWSTELIERLNALAARDDVQMHWLTTWLDDAPAKLCEPTGLNGKDWPVLGQEQYANGYSDLRQGQWWKHRALVDLAYEGRAVWVDDDLKYDRPAWDWATMSPNILPICPSSFIGITKMQMEAIEAWCDGLVLA